MCDTELFESLWVELKRPQVASHVNKVLLNVSYNPQKSFSGLFLENLSKSIEVAMLKTTNIVLMGDYNIDYLNQPEQNHLDSVLNHFALNVCCPTIPTIVGKTSETHIDYIIMENVQNSFVFDIPFKTDHFASILFSSEKMRDRKPIEKLIFDKSRFNRDEFRATLRSLDWDLMYNQCNADSILYTFISLLSGALKQHAPLKKVFIRTQKPEKHLKSEWFDDECKCLLQKRTITLKRYQRQTSAINWEKNKTLRAEFSELIAKTNLITA